MTKGKPWTSEQEKALCDLVAAKTSLAVIAEAFGKTQNAIRQKMIKLGLVEEKCVQRIFFFF